MDDHMQRSLVRVNDELRQFHLSNGRISMILGVAAGKLVNLYTGAAVPDSADFGYLHDDRFRVQSATVDERTERATRSVLASRRWPGCRPPSPATGLSRPRSTSCCATS